MNLTILKNTKDLVLIDVSFEDVIDTMSYPGFSQKTAYIQVTKGEQNTLTLIDKDGNQYNSFVFGGTRSTFITDNLKRLKQTVIKFLLSQHININKQTTDRETELEIMYWPNHLEDAYSIHLGGQHAIHLHREDIKEVFGEYTIVSKRTAGTGCIVETVALDSKEE